MPLTKQERLDAKQAFQDIAKRANEAARGMTKEDVPLTVAGRAVVEIQEMSVALIGQLIDDIID